MIPIIEGAKYTSVQEDIMLLELKKEFRRTLSGEVTSGMRNSVNGMIQINITALEHYIEQAYYLGKGQA